MKWTVRQEKLIKAVIRHERKCLDERYEYQFFNLTFCPFCESLSCFDCPNLSLTNLLELLPSAPAEAPCVTNASFTDTKTPTKRIQWWKDALKMTEGQFKEKYGKE